MLGTEAEADAAAPPTFDAVYQAYFEFVWRAVRRLGVPIANTDDAVQDVFVVVHRRLPDFEGRSTLKTWLFGIVLRVARDHRRLLGRKGHAESLPSELVDPRPGPAEEASKLEAWRILDRILDELGEEKREVFVLAEIEQLTVPEIAQVLELNLNTTYSRLKAARGAFQQALLRHHARSRIRGGA